MTLVSPRLSASTDLKSHAACMSLLQAKSQSKYLTTTMMTWKTTLVSPRLSATTELKSHAACMSLLQAKSQSRYLTTTRMPWMMTLVSPRLPPPSPAESSEDFTARHPLCNRLLGNLESTCIPKIWASILSLRCDCLVLGKKL